MKFHYYRHFALLFLATTYFPILGQAPVHEMEIFKPYRDMDISSDTCKCSDAYGADFRAINTFVRAGALTSFRLDLEVRKEGTNFYGFDGMGRHNDSIYYTAFIDSMSVESFFGDSCQGEPVCQHGLRMWFDAFNPAGWVRGQAMNFYPKKHDIGILYSLENKCPCGEMNDRTVPHSRKFRFDVGIQQWLWKENMQNYAITCECFDCQKCPTKRDFGLH